MKQSYKIPNSLDQSFLDLEIPIQNKDGIGIRPIPMKFILAVVASILLLMFVLQNTFIKEASFVQKVLFVAIWVVSSAVLLSYDKSKQLKIQLVPVLINYMPKANRYIDLHEKHANGFLHLVGIKKIAPNGTIYHTDNTISFMYRVVGSASILLFEEDKEAIINRVDSFYRKMSIDCEILFITKKEPQNIDTQLYHTKLDYDNLEFDDEDIKELYNAKFNILKNQVGNEFKSIHQYLILKCDNKEALRMAKNILQSEVENSTLMIKQCEALNYADIVDALKSIYRKRKKEE